MDFELRTVSDEECPAFSRTVHSAFGNQPSDEEITDHRSIAELDRTLGVFDQGRLVATAAALSFELTVAGETTVPAAGVTAVGVRTSHRRRGLLRAMMDRQLDDVAARGEPVAILTASESLIYGRFGYGLATSQLSVVIDPRHGAFARSVGDTGQIVMLDAEEAKPLAQAIHDRTRRSLPGDITRSRAWWDLAARDPDYLHRDASKLFWSLHCTAEGVHHGFVSYRVTGSWKDGLAEHEVVIIDLIAEDPTAEAALRRYVLDIDLASRVTARSRPVDEPLRWRLADPRRLRTTSLRDGLWVRIVDVPGALGARHYGIDGSVVIEVVDSFRPQRRSRYRLEAGSDGAACEATSPDLTLDVADLGVAYLGSPRFSLLSRAGRVEEHTQGALRRADQLLAAHIVPFCRTEF